MSRRSRRAPVPSPEVLEERARAKAEARLATQAEPGPQKLPEQEGPKQLFKVASHRVVHGKVRGDTVSLDPRKGATIALVQSGHLVPVQSANARAVTASSSVRADEKKEADHG